MKLLIIYLLTNTVDQWHIYEPISDKIFLSLQR